MAQRDWTSTRDLLPRTLVALAERTGSAGQLAVAWEAAVGASIAKCCRPSSWHGGVVTLTVNERSWLDELQRREHELRRRLSEVLGAASIRRLQFELSK